MHVVFAVEDGAGCWFEANDNCITPVSEETMRHAQAYMLFYSHIGGQEPVEPVP